MLAIAIVLAAAAEPPEQETPALQYTLNVETVYEQMDPEFCWMQPHCGSVPGKGENGMPLVVMVLQKAFLRSSDFYSPLHVLKTGDLGKTWSTPPEERQEMGWREGDAGTTQTIADVKPGWHPKTGKVLVAGHTINYANDKLVLGLRRYTGYSVYDPATDTWKQWDVLETPDPVTFYSSGSGCAQWTNEPDGTILLPVYFQGPPDEDEKPKIFSKSTVLRCAFDGETLTYLEHGTELAIDAPRGYNEPSITFYDGRYYLTLRNDQRGYVTTSTDGLHYDEPKPWTFDDGEDLGSYNTQQHWVAHSEGLYLAYTRRGANNDHIMRHRAPLFIAKVDTERMVVLRDTEQVLIPERGAAMGNFGVAIVSEDESWVTVGENMHHNAAEKGAKGAVLLARIRWSTPNALYGRVP